eukprot:Platyproteum_vivax@DN4655_c0_g1_i1.p1
MAGKDELLSQLDVILDSENPNFEKGLYLCTKILEAGAEPDLTIIQAKVFCLLNLNKHKQAFKIIEEAGNPSDLLFERCYCLYRLNRHSDCLSEIENGSEKHEYRYLNLKAQCLYRMGDYIGATCIYKELSSDETQYEEVEPEVYVNLAACYACVENPSTIADDDRLVIQSPPNQDINSYLSILEKHNDGYELLYNLGCLYVEMGEFEEAKERLNACLKLCDEEDMLQIELELAVIEHLKGNVAKAQALYQELSTRMEQHTDLATQAVQHHNLGVLQPHSKAGAFDALKRINAASKDTLEHKLTYKQNLAILQNKILLLLQANKIEQAKQSLQSLLNKTTCKRSVLCQAAIFYCEKKYGKCEDVLVAYGKSEQADRDDAILALIQSKLNLNQVDEAIGCFSQLSDKVKGDGSVMSKKIALHKQTGDEDGALKCLEESIEIWNKNVEKSKKGKDKETGRQGETGMEENYLMGAKLASSLGRVEAALKYFSSAIDLNKDNLEAKIGLVHTASFLTEKDPLPPAVKAAVKLLEGKASQAVSHLDAEELEMANVYVPKLVVKPKKDDVVAEETHSAKAKKRKKKIRYPKGFDAANPGPPPDPERWLPKYQRASWRKAHRKKDRRGGAQGATGDVATSNVVSTLGMDVDVEVKRQKNKGRKKK